MVNFGICNVFTIVLENWMKFDNTDIYKNLINSMKKLIYLVIATVVVVLLVSKDIRHKVYRSIIVAKNGAERLVFRGDHLETRFIDEGSFDSVIKEPGKLIIVSFQHELTSVAKTNSARFDAKIRQLPAKVLLAKVQAEKNEALLEKLEIDDLPTLQIYREGKLLREYKPPIDEDAFLADVEYRLKNWSK